MNHQLKTGFYAKTASCNVRYSKSFFTSFEDSIQLQNLDNELVYCKDDVDFIRCFIDNIKEKVIKKCKNLSSVKILLATFDKNNTIHQLAVAIANMMRNLLKIREKINLYKSIIVYVEYEGEMIFIGNLNFTGLD